MLRLENCAKRCWFNLCSSARYCLFGSRWPAAIRTGPYYDVTSYGAVYHIDANGHEFLGASIYDAGASTYNEPAFYARSTANNERAWPGRFCESTPGTSTSAIDNDSTGADHNLIDVIGNYHDVWSYNDDEAAA